jgi:hypothetical protein
MAGLADRAGLSEAGELAGRAGLSEAGGLADRAGLSDDIGLADGIGLVVGAACPDMAPRRCSPCPGDSWRPGIRHSLWAAAPRADDD